MASGPTLIDFATLASPVFRELLIGEEIARVLTIALFALTAFEYLITLDDEKRYFWKGPFSFSHGLFFFNRYFPTCVMMIGIVSFSVPFPAENFCKATIQLSFLLNLVAITMIQAILITRVWFLFPGVKVIRIGLILTFIASLATSFSFLYISANQFEVLTIEHDDRIHILGCKASRPPGFWRIYLPSLLMHTAIYVLTIYQAITKPVSWQRVTLRKRLLTDGGVFYLIVLFSVGFTSIGSFLTNVPRINIPAIFSPIVLAATSIATTRIMFSLRAEMADLGANFEWLPVVSPLKEERGIGSRNFGADRLGGGG